MSWGSGSRGRGYSLSSRIRTFFRHQDAPVTFVILGILAFVFVLQLLPGLGITQLLWFSPWYMFPELGEFEPWRMLTTMLTHSTSFIVHILFNGWAIYVLGRQMEPMLGRQRFITLFVAAGFGGSVAVLWLAPLGSAVVGASGAAFGLMGAFFVYLRKLGYNNPTLLFVIAANVALSFFGGSISWQAHLGGLATGAALGWVFGSFRYPYQRAQRRNGVTAVIVGLVGLTVVRILLGV